MRDALGFLNYSIDLMNLASGGINLTGDGEWVNTTLICFELADETIADPNACLNLIWARSGLTDAYATAFVEVSEWIGQNATANTEASTYDDLDENDGDDACISAQCGIGTPTENNDTACSDGVDNDNDGLIDCNDPNCESTTPCISEEQQFYGIRLALESFDCENNQACYAVELRSEGRTSFLLGNQNYSLFYNSDVATFVQGFSVMAQDIFSPFTLVENTENVNASTVGVLPFDDDLEFLNYSINLSGFEASTFEVPTNQWVKTSTLCFNVIPEAVGEPNTCFNVTWAQEGLTDGYENSFVEIDEFLGANQSKQVTGMLYDDLNSEDGDPSCFASQCSSFENNATTCSDGTDNDQDGLVDCADPDCTGLIACAEPGVLIGDFVFEDLNGNGIRDNGENGVDGIAISIFADVDQNGIADDINSPLATTVSGSDMDTGAEGNYSFSVPAGSYVVVVTDLDIFRITSLGQGNDNEVDNDFNPANNSTATITLAAGVDRADIDLGLFRSASISGIAFNDANSDGIAQASEDGINNIIVNLYKDLNQDGAPDNADEVTATTSTANSEGQDGHYEFTNLAPCPYVVEFKTGLGFTPTQKDVGGNDNVDSDIAPETGITMTIILQSGQTIDNIYAGYIAGTAVGDLVWNDADGDGVRDDTESGMNGITVRLFTSDGTLVSNTVTVTNPLTNEAGFYKFTDIAAGSYYIELILEGGLVRTEANAIGNEEIDSDITNDNGANTSATFTLSDGQVICDLDAGIYQGGTVNGIVWQDSEAGISGVFETGIDSPLENILVKLLNSDGEVVAETLTNANGEYTFTSIRQGSYSVMFVLPDNLSFVNANEGSDDNVDSEVVNVSEGTTELFFVGVGATINAINAGSQFGTLPVDLISFTGYWDRKADVNVINWSTLTEINNELFEIERSFDPSKGFKKIGELDGNGTSSTLIDYEFEDRDISLSGTYYYRLKQIDFNGDYEYSEVIAIDVNRIGKAYVKLIENTVSSAMMIEIFTEDRAVADIKLFDLNGRLITNAFDSNAKLARGKNRIEADAASLLVGQYILLVKMAEERFIKKVIKL